MILKTGFTPNAAQKVGFGMKVEVGDTLAVKLMEHPQSNAIKSLVNELRARPGDDRLELSLDSSFSDSCSRPGKRYVSGYYYKDKDSNRFKKRVYYYDNNRSRVNQYKKFMDDPVSGIKNILSSCNVQMKEKGYENEQIMVKNRMKAGRDYFAAPQEEEMAPPAPTKRLLGRLIDAFKG